MKGQEKYRQDGSFAQLTHVHVRYTIMKRLLLYDSYYDHFTSSLSFTRLFASLEDRRKNLWSASRDIETETFPC